MKRLTHEQFLDSITGIEALGEYRNSRSRIRVRCKKCGHEWHPVAHTLLQGCGCPECGKRKAAAVKKWNISQERFLDALSDKIKSEIDVLGEYRGLHKTIAVRCKHCGRTWNSKPCYLKKGQGCDSCKRRQKGINSRRTHSEFVMDIKRVHGDRLTVLGQYITGEHRILVRCGECGHEWSPVARRLYKRGCPQCWYSKGEVLIERILNDNCISFLRQFCFDDLKSPSGGRLRFDFAVMRGGGLSHLIEYDGVQHYRPLNHIGGDERFKKQKINDGLKDTYCLERNIRLVRIPYTDFSRISLEMLL